MAGPPVPDLIGWVREGERLFGAVLHTLQDYEQQRVRADRLEEENRQLREELACYRMERVEVADTLKAFAEHVTHVAARAIERLGKRTD